MRATNPIISDGANEKPGVVGRKKRIECAILYQQQAPCASCKSYRVCPLDSHQKQGVMAIVRNDPASVVAWLRPAEKARVIEELQLGGQMHFEEAEE